MPSSGYNILNVCRPRDCSGLMSLYFIKIGETLNRTCNITVNDLSDFPVINEKCYMYQGVKVSIYLPMAPVTKYVTRENCRQIKIIRTSEYSMKHTSRCICNACVHSNILDSSWVT